MKRCGKAAESLTINRQTDELLSPVLEKLDGLPDKGRVIIAVDGGSASGKTTLSKILEDVYVCTVFHMDDFFLQKHQRTPERLAEIGGNVDRERFLTQVLEPLSRGEDIAYRRFDCSSMSLTDKVNIIPERLVIVEGAYSMHPDLEGYYDFSVFLDIAPGLQRERILKRNTAEKAQRFFDEWIPLENAYFEKTDIKQRCDTVISVR